MQCTDAHTACDIPLQVEHAKFRGRFTARKLLRLRFSCHCLESRLYGPALVSINKQDFETATVEVHGFSTEVGKVCSSCIVLSCPVHCTSKLNILRMQERQLPGAAGLGYRLTAALESKAEGSGAS